MEGGWILTHSRSVCGEKNEEERRKDNEENDEDEGVKMPAGSCLSGDN